MCPTETSTPSTSVVDIEPNTAPTGCPPKFTETQIIAAGEALQASGVKHVTAYKLSKALGGGDRDRLLKIWKAHVAAQGAEYAPVDLPPELAANLEAGVGNLTQTMTALARLLYADALQEAEARFAEQRREAHDAMEAAQEDLADAEADAHAARKDLRAAENELAALRTQLHNEALNVARVQGELHQAKETIQQLQSQVESQGARFDAWLQKADLTGVRKPR